MAMYLCSCVAVWLCGYVAECLSGEVFSTPTIVFLGLLDPFLHLNLKKCLRGKINIVIGQLSRFELELKSEDSRSWSKNHETTEFRDSYV